MNKFTVKDIKKYIIKKNFIKKMQAKKTLQKYIKNLSKALYNKDELLSCLDKCFWSVSVDIDVPKKQKYLNCHVFDLKLGGITLDLSCGEIACDHLTIKIDNYIINRINEIIDSMVLL